MKRNLIAVLLAAASCVAVSCKKDNSALIEDTAAQLPDTKLLKDWYRAAYQAIPANLIQSSNAKKPGTPDWASTKYYSATGTYITPVKILADAKAKVFIKTLLSNAGSIKSQEYVFVSTKSTLELPDNEACSKLLNGTGNPEKFSGVVLSTDFLYNTLSARVFTGGAARSGNDVKVKYMSKSQATHREGNLESNGVECFGCYLVQYENGVEVSAELMYTWCTGGGSTSDTEEESDPSAGGQGSEGGEASVTIEASNSPTSSEDISSTEKTNFYDWVIYTAGTWGLMSHEKAVVKKVFYNNNVSRWEFQSFTHSSITPVGMNIGGTRTWTTDNFGVSFTQTRQTAWESLSFTVTHSASGLVPTSIPYTATAVNYAE